MSYGDPSKGWNPWILPPSEGLGFIRQALDLGVNFFDVADVYAEGSSEEFLGQALGQLARRDEVVIATKVGGRVGARQTSETNTGAPTTYGLSRKHIFDAVDASLRRLKTDHIDLYQIHSYDPTTPLAETLEALHDLVKAGKVRYIGASNTAAWRMAQALYTADLRGLTRFVSIQHHYNLIYRADERDLTPLLADEGVASMPWSPLARGFLAGNRSAAGGETSRAATDPTAARLYGSANDFAIVERVAATAKARGVAPTQVALAWLLARPGVTIPVVGATKPHHLPDAAAAVGLRLEPQEMTALEELYEPRNPVSPR
jgi:aryl-alcohol dehydrogenase (NADP+)